MKKILNCSILSWEPRVDMCGFLRWQPVVFCEIGRTTQRRHISRGKRKK